MQFVQHVSYYTILLQHRVARFLVQASDLYAFKRVLNFCIFGSRCSFKKGNNNLITQGGATHQILVVIRGTEDGRFKREKR